MSLNAGKVIYDQQHCVSVIFDSLPATTRTVAIKMVYYYSNKLVIKVEEIDNYNFNYTGELDNTVFNRMKTDQSLEINFDEMHSQIVDLLDGTVKQNMCLRLEATPNSCKLVFFEKSRLKSLIFLTIDLHITNQSEIIAEMARTLDKHKETNNSLSYQLEHSKTKLSEAKQALKSSVANNLKYEAHCKEQIALINNKFTTSFSLIEGKVLDRLSKIGRRHVKLQNDMEVLKNENKLKCESNLRLITFLQTLRLENERNSKIIEDFKLEVDHLRILKNNTDEESASFRRQLQQKNLDCESYLKQIDELKKDLQEATMIIAQKTRMHDEIAKDLVQANSMLVNFNNQYDNLAKDFDKLKLTLNDRDEVIDDLQRKCHRQEEDFNRYKAEYGTEKVQLLQNEIFLLNKSQQEIDKQYKEAIKLNALLTKKLSTNGNDIQHHNRTQNQAKAYLNSLPPPSQRSNY